MSGELTDFYVLSKTGNDGLVRWLVYRRSLIHCVDADVAARAAVAKAIRLAEFCELGGKTAQVHLRENDGQTWRTVWHSSRNAPRFP